MTDRSPVEPELTADERTLADQMHAGRPVPAAQFRGALSRHLALEDPGYGSRPNRLRLVASGYVVAGALVLGLGLLQATGTL
jgi:hypothetical protein